MLLLLTVGQSTISLGAEYFGILKMNKFILALMFFGYTLSVMLQLYMCLSYSLMVGFPETSLKCPLLEAEYWIHVLTKPSPTGHLPIPCPYYLTENGSCSLTFPVNDQASDDLMIYNNRFVLNTILAYGHFTVGTISFCRCS